MNQLDVSTIPMTVADPFESLFNSTQMTVTTFDDGSVEISVRGSNLVGSTKLRVQRKDLERALSGPSTWLEKRLLDRAAEEIRNGAAEFYRKPERWHEAHKWRCMNGHVRTEYVKQDAHALCCVCSAVLYLTFPEDCDGPLL